jgi:23S rRNA pseudouridine1911/1915/1917 synthase
MGENKTITLVVTENLANLRADIGLTQAGIFNSRSQIKKIFTDKKIHINGKYVKPSYLLQIGDQISAEIPLTPEESLEPYDIPLDIIFEDDDVIVLNKQSGLVVHPAHGHYKDTLINALMAHQKVLSPGSDAYRPGLVHRIDKDTSGLLVIAKNEKTHNSLARQFKNKTVHRVYHAIVFGKFKEPTGTIQSFIDRSPTDRKKFMSSDDPSGRWAVTHYEVLREGPHMSLVQLKLETGRTHQIRVHLSSIAHPVVGDETYGGKNRANGLASQALKKLILEMPRFALHAKELGFVHPGTHERIYFDSAWPQDLEPLMELCHLSPGEKSE